MPRGSAIDVPSRRVVVPVWLKPMPETLTPAHALAMLARLGATPWLVRHHELVLEAATVLCDRTRADLALVFDREQVLLGAAIHDAGKIVHPEEMSAPGHAHERAGEGLLIEEGVPADVARFCVTHASWDHPDVRIEDLLVALADKLWKGKRDDDLERRVADVIVRATKQAQWAVFDTLDAICDAIAADGPARLARSAV
jgi:hypothetical protein